MGRRRAGAYSTSTSALPDTRRSFEGTDDGDHPLATILADAGVAESHCNSP
ncbi:hypothetical protein [Ruania alba]|uniref:hypothetical protein n=1 Tax=Ruania alba TaxID=648782 RepID=UPI001587964E|nr:hypothetical protein [Ruania alba]